MTAASVQPTAAPWRFGGAAGTSNPLQNYADPRRLKAFATTPGGGFRWWPQHNIAATAVLSILSAAAGRIRTCRDEEIFIIDSWSSNCAPA